MCEGYAEGIRAYHGNDKGGIQLCHEGAAEPTEIRMGNGRSPIRQTGHNGQEMEKVHPKSNVQSSKAGNDYVKAWGGFKGGNGVEILHRIDIMERIKDK